MDAIEILMDEHRNIERMLAAIDVCAGRLGRGEDVTREDVHAFVRFIREYADALHHGKEEDMLFQDLMQHGMSRDAGPLAVMYAEHDEGRRYVGTIAAMAEGEGPFDDADRGTIANAMRAYTNLLRGHILKEDQVLYVMARQLLPPATMEELGRRFEVFAASDERAAPHDELLAVAADLAQRYAA
jgi:hemerythrin-like domain-containing protein